MGDLLIRRREMLLAESGGRLPTGYREVEYVASAGNVWFYIYASENQGAFLSGDVLQFRMMKTSGETSEEGLIGRRTGTGVASNSCELYIKSGAIRHWGLIILLSPSDGSSLSQNVVYDVSARLNNGFQSVCIFAYRENVYPFTGRFYSLSVTRSDSKIADLVPCVRTADSKAGMYDILNGVFYPSEGSGDLVAGPTV